MKRLEKWIAVTGGGDSPGTRTPCTLQHGTVVPELATLGAQGQHGSSGSLEKLGLVFVKTNTRHNGPLPSGGCASMVLHKCQSSDVWATTTFAI